jgi:hypothetical protein
MVAGHSDHSVIHINEAKDNIKRQKKNLRKQINGTFNNISCADENKYKNIIATIRSSIKKTNSVAFSPQTNYTDRATATCWRS